MFFVTVSVIEPETGFTSKGQLNTADQSSSKHPKLSCSIHTCELMSFSSGARFVCSGLAPARSETLLILDNYI